jgi:catechol 2,3-dioxygenase-like lactoylglutathione lyase family enzyme
MGGYLHRAFGYQGDAMNLPVANVASAVPFYESKLGFRAASRADTPYRAVVLTRDGVQMRLVENGGDSSQDGCAFHVTDIESLFAEFRSRGLQLSAIADEHNDHGTWQVFYVVAPDGLCYWFGEKQ